MNHIMIDVETTGLNPQKNGILQIGAVKFKPEGWDEGGPKDYFLNVCLSLAIGREWDPETRRWWQDHQEVLTDIQKKAIDPYNAMRQLKEFVGEEPVFWAKPTIFDYPFIESYFEQAGIVSPFNFRRVIDVRSYCAGLIGHDEDFSQFQSTVIFGGRKHYAVDDCIHQIKVVQRAYFLENYQ